MHHSWHQYISSVITFLMAHIHSPLFFLFNIISCKSGQTNSGARIGKMVVSTGRLYNKHHIWCISRPCSSLLYYNWIVYTKSLIKCLTQGRFILNEVIFLFPHHVAFLFDYLAFPFFCRISCKKRSHPGTRMGKWWLSQVGVTAAWCILTIVYLTTIYR